MFKNKVVRFNYSDFTTYFGLKSEVTNLSNTKENNYDKVSFFI